MHASALPFTVVLSRIHFLETFELLCRLLWAPVMPCASSGDGRGGAIERWRRRHVDV